MALLTNDIYVGSVSEPLYHFTNADAELGGFKGSFALDVIGNELTIDQFTVVVHWTEDDMFDGFITVDDELFICSNDEEFMVLPREGAPTELKNFLMELPYGTPVWWYVDGTFYAKGYLKSRDRVQKNGFRLTCVSGVGLLDTTMHVGGIYTGASMATVLQDIIGGAFPFQVNPSQIIPLRIYGRLPYDTRRNNLHRLLFATGVAMTKPLVTTYDYVFQFLSKTVTEIPASRVAIQGSVNYQLPTNTVEVTEHAFFYLESANRETLFDNTSDVPADHLTVIFDEAVYLDENTLPSDPNFDGLKTTGTLVINEAGVNYAVVSGQGTLTGKYYTHTTNLRVLTNNPNNDPERVRRVENNELVTAINSLNVARRVLSYYQSAKTVKARILTDGEQCGQLVQMTDSFGELTQAYLAKMDTLVTSVVGAQCQLIEGFQPGSGGNNFLHREAITSNGTWTVPAGVTFVRIALIGGGGGGQGGFNGEKGKNGRKGTSIFDPGVPDYALTYGTYYDVLEYLVGVYAYAHGEQEIAQGGEGGNPGAQGKVYVIEHAVTPGEVITFAIGVGGAGGAKNGGAGAAGTATSVSSTSIGNASSEDGLASHGYFDPLNGDVFATPGNVGIRGGNGGRTDTISLYGNDGGSGLKGDDCGEFKGGAGGAGYISGSVNDRPEIGSGGGGGGAAYGANGGVGGAAIYVPAHTEGEYFYGPSLETGSGGAGANALPPAKPAYGCAGAGGNGGGGGGNIGGGRMVGLDWTPASHLNLGSGGAPGQGSVGGAGGDGVALIYW